MGWLTIFSGRKPNSPPSERSSQARSATPRSGRPIEKDPPNVKGLFLRWVYRKFGIPGLVVLAIVCGIGFVWWKWDNIRSLPGIAPVVEWMSQEPLPKASPKLFAVAVTHLEKDDRREYEDLIVEALRGLEGVEILRFDRTITLEGSRPEERVAAGHKQARHDLATAGAQVLIWGRVFRLEGKGVVPRLYFTPSGELPPGRQAGYYAPMVDPTGIQLPDIFWKDLADVLRLLVLRYGADFQKLEGRFVADKLGSFIEKVRRLFDGSQPLKGWSAEAELQVRQILADSLRVFGQQTGKNDPLKEAVAVYRQVLTALSRERAPIDWARVQQSLGIALEALGARESGTAHLEEAVEAFRESLQELTQTAAPLDWARTENSLGNALHELGRRESGTIRFRDAVVAYREALKEYTREREPLNWALVRNNLANALRVIGEREKERAPLEEAVKVYRDALPELNREHNPLDWARTQHNLGIALLLLGRSEEAEAASRAALKEWTREKVPLDWAVAQNTLGNELRVLGESKSDAALICEALGSHLAAWEVLSAEEPVSASDAVENVRLDLTALRRGFEPQRIRPCLKQYEAELDGFEKQRRP